MKFQNPEEVLSRLTELTKEGQISWGPVYRNDPSEFLEDVGMMDSDFFSEVTHPIGYLAEDERFGFGFVALSMDPYSLDEDDMVLYIMGSALPASQADLSILRDYIELYIESLQRGGKSSHARFVEELLAAHVNPLQEQIAHLTQHVMVMDEVIGRQMVVIDRLTALLSGNAISEVEVAQSLQRAASDAASLDSLCQNLSEDAARQIVSALNRRVSKVTS
ncbi:MAG: hypothetical protein D6800_06685 [Candidatus Zixiibacteriota bacterium]|nr:MAG: hypothetical protein D6800_06685 [candidate division Zixibacteria bacterium]